MSDPLSAIEPQVERVVLEDLPTWASIPVEETNQSGQASVDFTPVFDVREDLNQKIYLWYAEFSAGTPPTSIL